MIGIIGACSSAVLLAHLHFQPLPPPSLFWDTFLGASLGATQTDKFFEKFQNVPKLDGGWGRWMVGRGVGSE